MLALIVPELLDLLRVAGKTGLRDIAGEGNVQRCVRILMATEASLEFVVRLSHMAVVALGNGFLHGRRMTDMTAHASHVLVFPAGGGQVRRRRGMAFNAVIVGQNRLGLRRRGAAIHQKQRDPHEQERYEQKTILFH